MSKITSTQTADGQMQWNITDDGTPFGIVGGKIVQVSTEITTTATQAAYAINDAVLPNGGGVAEIAGVARQNGGSGYIAGIRISTNKKSITPQFRLHLFNASNPTIANDNAAWKDLYADASKRVGYYDMPAMVTAADTTNSDMSRTLDFSVLIPFACAGGSSSLWFALETLTAFTPDNSQKFTVTLIVVQQ